MLLPHDSERAADREHAARFRGSAAIADDAIRYSHLTAIAPTGSISLLAGSLSSRVERVLVPTCRRAVLDETGLVASPSSPMKAALQPMSGCRRGCTRECAIEVFGALEERE